MVAHPHFDEVRYVLAFVVVVSAVKMVMDAIG